MDRYEEPTELQYQGREIVRSFSDKLKTQDGGQTELGLALERGLDDVSADDRRRRQAFQRSALGGCTFDRANTESERIQQAWKAFVAKLGDETAEKGKTPWRSRKDSTSVDAQLKDLEVSTVDDVLDELNAVQKSWVEKDRLLGGKAQAQFHKVCNALADHDKVFDMIPNQNNYAATLCGSLRMLIRASANHVKYAEELGHALDDISDEIGQAGLLLAVMNVPEMERRVEELYVKIFVLIRRAMIWYQSSALRKVRYGLNEGLYDKLKEDVDAIKAQASAIQRDAQARGLVENRETRLITESAAIDARKGLIVSEAAYDRLGETQQTGDATLLHVYQIRQQLDQEREERRKDNIEVQRLMKLFSRQLANGLTDQGVQSLIEDFYHQRRLSEAAKRAENSERLRLGAPIEHEESLSRESSQHRDASASDASPAPATHTYRRTDLLTASEHLDDFIVGQDERDLALRKPPRLASHTLARKLQAWSRSSASQRLWILGPPQAGVPSALAGAAVNVLRTSQYLQIPVIAHACDRSRMGDPCTTQEESGIIGLTYSLIRQLVALLPEEMESPQDLSLGRFEKLDGTVESWEEALDVFSSLMSCSSPLLLCLIDGLNRLESGDAMQMCEDLLDRLDEAQDSNPDQERAVKLLFTSSGNCRTLRDWLLRGEICMVEDAPPARQSSNNLGDGTTPLVLRDVFSGQADED